MQVTVTFANAVTQVGMPQANLTAQLLGLGGATIDATSQLSVNKAASGNDAAFAFKTEFSVRALIGLLGNDNFSFKVSPNGSTFFDANAVYRTNGQVELPHPRRWFPRLWHPSPLGLHAHRPRACAVLG